MPEGPELCYMGEYVASLARDRVFTAISRSTLADHPKKHPEIVLPKSWALFTITSESRGKEMRVIIRKATVKKEEEGDGAGEESSKGKGKRAAGKGKAKGKARAQSNDSSPTVGELAAADDEKPITILFRAGMTGNFIYKRPDEEFRKHAHLRFHDTTGGAICFEDSRRFGSWQVTDDWGPPEERGPCIIKEAEEVRKHLAASLDLPVFSKPICEVMLDQRYFNGMGNYLRAEILHLAGVHPSIPARTVITHFLQDKYARSPNNFFNVLQRVCAESLEILRKYGFDGDEERLSNFEGWLKCYFKLDSEKDGLGRTIWFSKSTPKKLPDPENPAPQEKKSAGRKRKQQEEPQHIKQEAAEAVEEETKKTKEKKSNSPMVETPVLKRSSRVSTKTIKIEPMQDGEVHDKQKQTQQLPSPAVVAKAAAHASPFLSMKRPRVSRVRSK